MRVAVKTGRPGITAASGGGRPGQPLLDPVGGGDMAGHAQLLRRGAECEADELRQVQDREAEVAVDDLGRLGLLHVEVEVAERAGGHEAVRAGVESVAEMGARGITTDPTVVATGIWLLFVAALFQLFDGLQGVATGVLRGLGDTRTAMVSNVAGHWVFGLPVGYLLCFVGGWGVVGLWVGLCIGLVLVAITLVWTWTQRSRANGRGERA